jgi:hypothetical protein
MWAKASISLLSELAREAGEAQPDLGERREVGRNEGRRAASGFNVGDDASASFRITAMYEHARPGLPELASDEPADPVRRTGNQYRLPAQLFHPALLR